jgi:transcriptional regulator with XRE-family HTH domain
VSDEWQKERMVSPLEFQLLLSALKLSQAACGRYLGVSSRTVSRYLHGEARIPAASVLLLRGILEKNIIPLVPKRPPRRPPSPRVRSDDG